jgi:hypothetical protein
LPDESSEDDAACVVDVGLEITSMSRGVSGEGAIAWTEKKNEKLKLEVQKFAYLY